MMSQRTIAGGITKGACAWDFSRNRLMVVGAESCRWGQLVPVGGDLRPFGVARSDDAFDVGIVHCAEAFL